MFVMWDAFFFWDRIQNIHEEIRQMEIFYQEFKGKHCSIWMLTNTCFKSVMWYLLPKSHLSRYLAELDLDQFSVADLVQLEKELGTALVQTIAAKISANVRTSTLHLLFNLVYPLNSSMFLISTSIVNKLANCGQNHELGVVVRRRPQH